MNMRRTGPVDVAIVGGGPAGLVTALACRREGLEVEVIERRRPPLDKACGEGLMPDGVAILRSLGIDFDSPDGLRHHPFHGIHWIDSDGTRAAGRFPAEPGRGVRRLDLHDALVRRAARVGVGVRWGVRVESLDTAGPTPRLDTSDGPLEAQCVVGADGLRSRVRQWADLAVGDPAAVTDRSRFGIRRHYALAPWSNAVEVYWADDCEAYVTPVAPDEVGIAILWSGRKASFDGLLRSFPALAQRLEGADHTSQDRGAGPLRQKVRRAVRGRVALVGDAAGYVDAITGEGLSLALHQALALARALAQASRTDGQPTTYEWTRRRLALLPDGLTHLLLTIERYPWLRRRMIRGLARDPALFSRLLALHTREVPVHRLGWSTAPRLVWGLVRA